MGSITQSRKDRQKKQRGMNASIIIQILHVLATLAFLAITRMLYVTTSSLQGNDFEKRMVIEKYRNTIDLCGNFNTWYGYGDYRKKEDDLWLDTLKQWENSKNIWLLNDDSLRIKYLVDDPLKIKYLKDSLKVKSLQRNLAVRKLFSYFENAKELDKRGLLDRDYFFNTFYSRLTNLEKIENPSVVFFLQTYRKEMNNSRIYDGYDHFIKLKPDYDRRMKIMEYLDSISVTRPEMVELMAKYL